MGKKIKKKSNRKRQIIGRKDKADFPSLKLKKLEVKIDTGAFTSAIHCEYISLSEDGKSLTFSLLDPTHKAHHGNPFTFTKFRKRKIRSSNGYLEERFLIEANIKLFEKTFPIELALTDRSNMNTPVLLGRRLLRAHFLVDVSKVDLSYTQQRKKKKAAKKAAKSSSESPKT
ncbi:MAG: RimK/LysX family protein [Bacteroidota bacterium]